MLYWVTYSKVLTNQEVLYSMTKAWYISYIKGALQSGSKVLHLCLHIHIRTGRCDRYAIHPWWTPGAQWSILADWYCAAECPAGIRCDGRSTCCVEGLDGNHLTSWFDGLSNEFIQRYCISILYHVYVYYTYLVENKNVVTALHCRKYTNSRLVDRNVAAVQMWIMVLNRRFG